MPYRALVVDADEKWLSATKQILTSAGYLVVCASQFEDAKRRLTFAPPDLLVTTIKLGANNGLHLVLRAHADNPTLPAIVIDEQWDPVLETEAKKLGAEYLVGPRSRDTLVPLAEKLLAKSEVQPSSVVERRWPRKTAAIPANVAGSRATVVDVSYGGMRLELSGVPNDTLSGIGAVSIPRLGLIPIHPVWARGGVGAPTVWWCGAEVEREQSSSPAQAWRTFVDSLN